MPAPFKLTPWGRRILNVNSGGFSAGRSVQQRLSP